ncbi:hypothetical protein GJU43_21900 [Flavobacterium sp. LC2016-23]|uniref:hypothetical protein n=1 Tax=Flavobacterium sp. LC2016-23 TaxID=2666330 RepID=UPI0012AEE2E8|nr:hypothetical protein [Flavobacterium sp. LC2016-23]MRX41941.1 hypothetical protein [Flavobacterium sp. LC2016-23]
MVTRNLILITLLILFVLPSKGQTPQSIISNTKQLEKQIESPIYRLFPTENYWTFIKLDTRNGKMWQVHFTISAEGYEGELVLNSDSLVMMTEEVNGRFTLYPTKNTYNFLLLDQMNGKTYQVQWNSDKEKRFVSRI